MFARRYIAELLPYKYQRKIAMDFSTYLDNLNWRYATKQFDSERSLSDEQLDFLMEATRLSPSSYGVQPWKFVVVPRENTEIREQLQEAGYGQPQFADASHVFVLCGRRDIDKDYIDQFMEAVKQTQDKTDEDVQQFRETLYTSFGKRDQEQLEEWSARQVYIALGFLLTAAAQLEIDACPMEGFDNQKFDEILGLTDTEYTSQVVCSVGFRGDDPHAEEEKVRFSQDEVFDIRE